ncbi:MAG: hypothetical protein IJ248_03285 [Candidatus Methanomethylophilaceae archaeon]|nr:hypothetical protein [Candidatus Methanomethylophilaceae archaeon]
MNRFLSVWLSSLSIKALTIIAIAAIAAVLLFFVIGDPIIISLEALAIGIGLLIYFRSKSQGIDSGLISDSNLMNKRYLSFQLSCGMSRKEYVDSYSLMFFMIMPLVFMVFLAVTWSVGDGLEEKLVFAATLTLVMLPLLYIVIYHNICTMTGRNDYGRFLLMILLFLVLFFGTFLCLTMLSSFRSFGVFISITISLISTLKLRELSIAKMLGADI